MAPWLCHIYLHPFQQRNKGHSSNQRNCLWVVNPCFLWIIVFTHYTLWPQKPQNLCQVLPDAALSPGFLHCPTKSSVLSRVPKAHHPPTHPTTSLFCLLWPSAKEQTVEAAINQSCIFRQGKAGCLHTEWARVGTPLPLCKRLNKMV